jgi:hypothetical protein
VTKFEAEEQTYGEPHYWTVRAWGTVTNNATAPVFIGPSSIDIRFDPPQQQFSMESPKQSPAPANKNRLAPGESTSFGTTANLPSYTAPTMESLSTSWQWDDLSQEAFCPHG